MLNEPFVIRQEAQRLAGMTRLQARREFNNLVSRTFLIARDTEEFASQLDFNARLSTMLREQGASLWLP